MESYRRKMNPDSAMAPPEPIPTPAAPVAPAAPARRMKKRIFVPTARAMLAPEASIRPLLITVIEEFESYNREVSPDNTDPLQFWQVSIRTNLFRVMGFKNYFQSNKQRWKTLYAMAMDYLSAQASSVPSERIFSSSAETDTARRNSLSSNMMEALQMLKFALKQRRNSQDYNFLADWVTSMESLEERYVEPDVDALTDWFGATSGTQAYAEKMENILVEYD